MDKILKFLRRRDNKERLLLITTITLIVNEKTKNLDVKKLKGLRGIFRVRIGDFRIIYKKSKPKNLIIKIDKRDDSTYKI